MTIRLGAFCVITNITQATSNGALDKQSVSGDR